ncbi:unnamed protein product [Darwinula stevensoni]|uniref:Uncharacterized protein n=1 Tax=Darwinula stevensoni TaxID=69355 RepID=A0A7R9ADP1_9CRUS|nr:unnamed protein product [Darwinula stevensoni]CAG0901279.1 unnamed protein product [Darwinula stevensoni]
MSEFKLGMEPAFLGRHQPASAHISNDVKDGVEDGEEYREEVRQEEDGVEEDGKKENGEKEDRDYEEGGNGEGLDGEDRKGVDERGNTEQRHGNSISDISDSIGPPSHASRHNPSPFHGPGEGGGKINALRP